MGAHVIPPPKRVQARPSVSKRVQAVRRWLAGWRQSVARARNDLLTVFRLARERPHSLAGVRARLAATVSVRTVGHWLNRTLGRPPFAFADPLDG